MLWAQQLQLYDKATNGKVSPQQVIADWNAAKDLQRTGKNLGQYANITMCRLPKQVAIDDMAKILKSYEAAARRARRGPNGDGRPVLELGDVVPVGLPIIPQVGTEILQAGITDQDCDRFASAWAAE